MSVPEGVPPHILGLMLASAEHHVQVARQALSSRRRPRLLHALHQLKGLCAQAGLGDLAGRAHRLEDVVTAAAGVSGARETVLAELDHISAALAQVDGADRSVGSVALSAVAGELSRALAAMADRRGVALAYDPPAVADAALSAPVAAALIDIAGHLVRNAVVHGGRGGRVAVSLACWADDATVACAVTSSDPGPAATGEVDIDAGRGLGIAAARARARALGGSLQLEQRDGTYRATLRLPRGAGTPAGAGR